MTTNNILKLVGCIALPLIIGGISGYFTIDGVNGWYATSAKPSFNPPNYVFGPVWTILYALMGISLYFILSQPASQERTIAIYVFATQLFLNFCWSIIFFSLQKPFYALIEIGVLWLSILWMIIALHKVKPVAGYLQIPYLLWVSFASVLNGAVWWLNK